MKITKVIYEQLYPVINEPFFNVRLGGEASVTEGDNINDAYHWLKKCADTFHKQNWSHMYSADGTISTQTPTMQVDKKGDSVPKDLAFEALKSKVFAAATKEDAQEIIDSAGTYSTPLAFQTKSIISQKPNK